MTDIDKLIERLGSTENWKLSETMLLMPQAAQALRDLRADFEEYADHDIGCDAPEGYGPCTCGYAAARKRWETKV